MKVFDKAIESRLDRRSTFVALGGGVIGDMCGFAAASFLRGVNFIQIPTTVMAQVLSCSFLKFHFKITLRAMLMVLVSVTYIVSFPYSLDFVLCS